MEKIRTTAHWEGDKLVVDLPKGVKASEKTFLVELAEENEWQRSARALAEKLNYDTTGYNFTRQDAYE